MASSTPRWFMLRPCRACVQSPEWGIGSLRARGFSLRGARGGSPPPQVVQHRGILLLGAGSLRPIPTRPLTLAAEAGCLLTFTLSASLSGAGSLGFPPLAFLECDHRPQGAGLGVTLPGDKMLFPRNRMEAGEVPCATLGQCPGPFELLCPCPYSRRCMNLSSVQFSSVTQSCLTLCDPMNRSTPGLPVHHQLPEFTQTHVH